MARAPPRDNHFDSLNADDRDTNVDNDNHSGQYDNNSNDDNNASNNNQNNNDNDELWIPEADYSRSNASTLRFADQQHRDNDDNDHTDTKVRYNIASNRSRSTSRKHRYLKRSESQPDDNNDNDNITSGNTTSRSQSIRMNRLDLPRGSTSLDQKEFAKVALGVKAALGLRHRRTKSHYHNGYDYYRQLQRQLSAGFDDDGGGAAGGGGEDGGIGDGADQHHHHYLDFDDNDDEDGGYKMTVEDLKRTRDFLATIRVRRSKSRKKRSFRIEEMQELQQQQQKANGAGVDVAIPLDDLGGIDDEDGEFEELVGLPSATKWRKGLSERLTLFREADSSSTGVKEYRFR